MAYQIGLKPKEFWELTPREFQLMIEAFNENESQAHDARAWSLATLICSLGQFKRRPNPRKMFDELSGRARRRGSRQAGNEKIAQIMKESRKRVSKRQESNGR